MSHLPVYAKSVGEFYAREESRRTSLLKSATPNQDSVRAHLPSLLFIAEQIARVCPRFRRTSWYRRAGAHTNRTGIDDRRGLVSDVLITIGILD